MSGVLETGCFLFLRLLPTSWSSSSPPNISSAFKPEAGAVEEVVLKISPKISPPPKTGLLETAATGADVSTFGAGVAEKMSSEDLGAVTDAAGTGLSSDFKVGFGVGTALNMSSFGFSSTFGVGFVSDFVVVINMSSLSVLGGGFATGLATAGLGVANISELASGGLVTAAFATAGGLVAATVAKISPLTSRVEIGCTFAAGTAVLVGAGLAVAPKISSESSFFGVLFAGAAVFSAGLTDDAKISSSFFNRSSFGRS